MRAKNSSFEFCLVLELLQLPKSINPYLDLLLWGGDVVGPVEHLLAKPRSYHCNVHCAGISSMGRTQKLQNDVERTGVEENLRKRGKDSESRKEPLHQS